MEFVEHQRAHGAVGPFEQQRTEVTAQFQRQKHLLPRRDFTVSWPAKNQRNTHVGE